MTSKLLRKLQTTTRKITAEFGSLCGRQEVCRVSVLFAAALTAGFASGADNWVRSTDYQQISSGGNVPLTRIETTVAEEDSQVVQVSYVAPVASASAPSSGKELKWVSVNDSKAAKVSETKRPLVTQIPSVMPSYSHVLQTAGEEEMNLDSLGSLDSLEVAPETLDAENATVGPLALPSTEDETASENVEAGDSLSDAQIPGAIGNEKESMLEQGGLKQNTTASEAEKTAEMVETPAPKETVEQEALPAPMVPVPLPKEPSNGISDSFTMRQVDESDYDMPCESSEPMHRITEITNDIELHDHKIIPKSCPLSPEGENFPVREFPGTHFTWTASNLCHNPLYFEQPDLERYGHTIGPLQPVASGVGFLATIPALPMLMAIDPPNECQYALGYNRPGSCAPYKWSPIPFSMRGAIATGGVATALVFLIP